MSNETHQEVHHENHGQAERAKSKTSFQSSFWFVVILVGVFIAALNFVEVMSKGGEEGEKMETKKEMTAPAKESEKKEGKQEVAAPAHEDTTQVKH